ncbi:hypothetical protein KKJ09_19500 [Xenorhabdus bovienii]|uniref:hypothetical protein n=1 Tax=Xenorhabdus bovienii TaxID=40576 RepID=UPI0023B326EC|nr:hypothetical protein [Xenorhabdus bovienii]MDE9443896.1 hypothetical protein [Xenorhabdus bovienii]MDE9495707.1 hypothetical protein [Xenorhabdus bovienii]MDE9504110.1 hypothetical protein [Xenorhabdus bovienii]
MRGKDSFPLLAYVANKKDLRRVWGKGWKTITPSQRVWVRYLMMIWGRQYGGNEYHGGECSVIGRLMTREDWTDAEGERIVKVVKDLHKLGYEGEGLFQKAHEILNPKQSLSDIIALAKESDDAAFVESVLNRTFKLGNPVRDVAIKRYCDRKCPQKIARELSRLTGCDVQQARKRAVWSEELLEEEMYYAIKREIRKESHETCH